MKRFTTKASNGVQWYVWESVGAENKIAQVFYSQEDAEEYIASREGKE